MKIIASTKALEYNTDEDDYMDAIFRREAKHDVMMAAIVCFFMILLLIAFPVCGDAPLPLPAKHEVLSPNKKFRAELDPREGTKIIRLGSGTVPWKLPDWYRWAFLADDGEHFVVRLRGIESDPVGIDEKAGSYYFLEERQEN